VWVWANRHRGSARWASPWIIDPETEAVGPWWDLSVDLVFSDAVGGRGWVTNAAGPIQFSTGGGELVNHSGSQRPPGVVTSTGAGEGTPGPH